MVFVFCLYDVVVVASLGGVFLVKTFVSMLVFTCLLLFVCGMVVLFVLCVFSVLLLCVCFCVCQIVLSVRYVSIRMCVWLLFVLCCVCCLLCGWIVLCVLWVNVLCVFRC